MADKIDGICMKITPQKEVVLWLLSHVIRLIYFLSPACASGAPRF
jgi:hypothetical protein